MLFRSPGIQGTHKIDLKWGTPGSPKYRRTAPRKSLDFEIGVVGTTYKGPGKPHLDPRPGPWILDLGLDPESPPPGIWTGGLWRPPASSRQQACNLQQPPRPISSRPAPLSCHRRHFGGLLLLFMRENQLSLSCHWRGLPVTTEISPPHRNPVVTRGGVPVTTE